MWTLILEDIEKWKEEWLCLLGSSERFRFAIAGCLLSVYLMSIYCGLKVVLGKRVINTSWWSVFLGFISFRTTPGHSKGKYSLTLLLLSLRSASESFTLINYMVSALPINQCNLLSDYMSSWDVAIGRLFLCPHFLVWPLKNSIIWAWSTFSPPVIHYFLPCFSHLGPITDNCVLLFFFVIPFSSICLEYRLWVSCQYFRI